MLKERRPQRNSGISALWDDTDVLPGIVWNDMESRGKCIVGNQGHPFGNWINEETVIFAKLIIYP